MSFPCTDLSLFMFAWIFLILPTFNDDLVHYFKMDFFGVSKNKKGCKNPKVASAY